MCACAHSAADCKVVSNYDNCMSAAAFAVGQKWCIRRGGGGMDEWFKWYSTEGEVSSLHSIVCILIIFLKEKKDQLNLI